LLNVLSKYGEILPVDSLPIFDGTIA